MQAHASPRRGLFVLALFAALLLAPAARADEAEQIYDPGAMVEIDLGLSGPAESELEAAPFDDVEGTFSAWLDSNGIPGGARTTLAENHPVEVRLKGHLSGSFRPLASGKSGFKLKFKKTERFLGLRKMTLNNMVEDTSMIHETLAYGLFRAAGVPASRTGYAYVRVNGEDFGVYLDLENLDETFLKAHYGEGNTLHLYEGEYGADADAASIATLGTEPPEGQPKFEMDEGKGEPTDLEALASAVAAASPSFSTRLAGLADLVEMTRMWAVEKYVSHWDGYSGEEASNKPNNYYLHSDFGGLFQMLPWGTDNTWQIERRIGFDGHAGLLFNGCLGDVACFGDYYSALEALQGQVAAFDPDGLAVATAALLKPWQEEEEDESTRGEHSVAEIEEEVAKVRQYVAERPGELTAWLATNEPPAEEPPTEEPPVEEPPTEEPPTEEPPAEEQHSGPVDQPKPIIQFPSPNSPPSPEPHVVRVNNWPGQLRLRIRLQSPGRLRAWVSIRTREGRRRVCAPDVATDTAGVVVLPCRYPDSVRRRLRHHQLRMRVVLRFDALDGATATTVRQVTVPRG